MSQRTKMCLTPWVNEPHQKQGLRVRRPRGPPHRPSPQPATTGGGMCAPSLIVLNDSFFFFYFFVTDVISSVFLVSPAMRGRHSPGFTLHLCKIAPEPGFEPGPPDFRSSMLTTIPLKAAKCSLANAGSSLLEASRSLMTRIT